MKTRKEILVVKFLDYMKGLNVNDPDIQFILNRLPFFKKEFLEYAIEPMVQIEHGFDFLEEFIDEEKNYHVTLLRVTNSISPRNCVKKIKMMSRPHRALFLGEEGLNYLKLNHIEKIKDNRIVSFVSKKSQDKEYVPGLYTNKEGYSQHTLIIFKSSMVSSGTIVAVFCEL